MNSKKLSAILAGLFCAINIWAQTGHTPLKITHLTGGLYVYTTFNVYNNTLVPSNSMYLLTSKGVVLFDTPWDTTQFQPLLDSIEARHEQKVILCIATHYHEDRTGGLGFLKAKGIKTYTSKQTYILCKKYNMNEPEYYFQNDTVFTVGNSSFQTYYGGEGHTQDNIVVWLEKEKVLYGGCLVKSTEATNLGNIKNANLPEWPVTIRKVKKKFPDPAFIIPGHDDWKSTKSLDHTLELLRVHKQKS